MGAAAGGTLDPPLTPIAAAISGVPEAQVFCGGNDPRAWGEVTLTDGLPDPLEYLDPILCRSLHRFQKGWRPMGCKRKLTHCSAGYLALAASVLTHESIHISGDLDEASTECKAIQRTRRTLGMLGEMANPLYVEVLVHYALWWHVQLEHYVNWWTGVRDYYSPECHADGALDETPGDGIWP